MQDDPRSFLSTSRRVVVHFRSVLGAGLLVTLPIAITILVFKFFFDLLDPLLQPALQFLPGPHIPGLGILALLVIIYVIGLVATQVVGRRLIDAGHRLIERIPVVRSIYGTTRSGVEMLSGGNGGPYRGVVLVDFPRMGTKAIGLVTSNLGRLHGKEMVSVYVPTTPVPSSGFLLLVPIAETIPLDMSADDALKMIISGGILSGDVFGPSQEPTPVAVSSEE
jgi:uncharacterized membrane protein